MPQAAVHVAVERRVPRLALVPQDQLHARQANNILPSHQAKKRSHLTGDRYPKQHLHHEHFGTSEVEVSRSGEHNGTLERDDSAIKDADDVNASEEQQLRLGERFLRMMAAMARLSRLPLDDHDGGNFSPAVSPQLHQQPTALEKIVQKKEALALQKLSPHKTVPATSSTPTGGGSPTKGAAVPQLVPVNAATEPLRPHLTFEISMLLPQPIDTRQSSLQSSIQRKQLHPPRRRRKRKRHLRGEKRSWQTSHATWAPRASAACIQEHSRIESRSSKLMDKFAQLKKAAELSSQLGKSSSMPALNSSKYVYAFPLNKKAVAAKWDRDGDSGDDDNEDYEEDDEGESDDQEEADEDKARSESNEPTFSSFLHFKEESGAASHTYLPDEAPPPTRSITTALDPSSRISEDGDDIDNVDSAASPSPPAAAAETATSVAIRKRPLFHQPAWISPELKTWLISSGMFPTKPRHAAAASVAVLR